MAEFNISGEKFFNPYPFDYHSHFPGILPVESNRKWEGEDVQFNDAGEKIFKVLKGQELSLIGLLIRNSLNNGDEWPEGEKLKAARQGANFKLFCLALDSIIKDNPFKAADFTFYRRGECAAENIYLACLILLHKFGFTGVYDPAESDMFRTVLGLLETGAIKTEESVQIVAYFNRKIFSANKYTPFDDAYWARSAVRDHKDYKVGYNWMTLCYLYREGIRYTQTAMSASGARELDPYFQEFNLKKKTGYKILAHTAHVYEGREAFESELNKIKNLFVADSENSPKIPDLVGIDLLGSETRDGQYRQFFEFLEKEENRKIFAKYNALVGEPTKKVVLHIHCGEGSGVSVTNRSLFGYYLRNIPSLEDRNRVCAEFGTYAWACYRKALSTAQARKRERDIEDRPSKNEAAVSTLFDELFYNSSLTVDGLLLKRFDITSPVSQSLVAYSAKTNITHLASELEFKPQDGPSFYSTICGDGSPYTMRTGHAYAFRNDFGAKFPRIYFDTNLGSNFITGASGLFDSVTLYRLNRGLRHLDGFMETETLDRALDTVLYMGSDRLNRDQKDAVGHLASLQNLDLDDTGTKRLIDGLLASAGVPVGEIRGTLRTFLCSHYQAYLRQNPQADGETLQTLKMCQRIRRVEAYEKLAAVALNWRAYILGADGQGVEHSDVQIEALRMTLILACGLDYRALGFGDDFLTDLNKLIFDIGKLYWHETIGGTVSNLPDTPRLNLKKFEGFTGPASVVRVKIQKT